jgi:hypothetical protein
MRWNINITLCAQCNSNFLKVLGITRLSQLTSLIVITFVIAANPATNFNHIRQNSMFIHGFYSLVNRFEPTPVILAPMGLAFYKVAANKVHKQHYTQLFFLLPKQQP